MAEGEGKGVFRVICSYCGRLIYEKPSGTDASEDSHGGCSICIMIEEAKNNKENINVSNFNDIIISRAREKVLSIEDPVERAGFLKLLKEDMSHLVGEEGRFSYFIKEKKRLLKREADQSDFDGAFIAAKAEMKKEREAAEAEKPPVQDPKGGPKLR